MNTSKNLENLISTLELTKTSLPDFLNSFRFDKRGKIITMGNGGSAAEAQHLTEELLGKYDLYRPPITSICLNSCSATLTCIANDFGYKNVFKRQLDAFAGKYDTLVCFSTSGDSENIYRALIDFAGTVKNAILLTGKTGGACKAIANVLPFVVPSNNTARIQEVHQFIMHELVEKAERELL